MQPNDAAMRKRTQIAKANRVMFLWVAVVSVIVGFGLVGSIFLAQKLFFNEKVIAEKQKTVATLKADNANVPQLESQIRVLNTSQALIDSVAQPTDQPVQAILDALPSDANSLALGASLQSKLLGGINGLTVQSLQVNPVTGVEQLASDGTSQASTTTTTSGSSNQITFSFSVSGTSQVLYQVLNNLERSIRTINVTNIRIESQGANQVMTVQAYAYYEPAVNLQLTTKLVKP
jgi:hypothetical protein